MLTSFFTGIFIGLVGLAGGMGITKIKKIFKRDMYDNKGVLSSPIDSLKRKEQKEVMGVILSLQDNYDAISKYKFDGQFTILQEVLSKIFDYDDSTFTQVLKAIQSIKNHILYHPDEIIRLDRFQDLIETYIKVLQLIDDVHKDNPTLSIDNLLDKYTKLYDSLTKVHLGIIKEANQLLDNDLQVTDQKIKFVEHQVRQVVGDKHEI